MILFATMKHDFILNYLFLKNFNDQNKNLISGSVLKYFEMPLKMILDSLKNKIS